MTLVSGELKLVTDNPEVVSQVWLRAPKERLHGTGMVTTGSDSQPVKNGVVSFSALPGPVVMVLLANGIPTSTVKLLVPDKGNATLRECIEAVGLADDGTLSALEELALETARIAAQIASADQLETWATETATAAEKAQLNKDESNTYAARAEASASEAQQHKKDAAQTVSSATAYIHDTMTGIASSAEEYERAAAESASKAKISESNAENYADVAQSSADEFLVDLESRVNALVPPKVADSLAQDSTVVDAAALAVDSALDGAIRDEFDNLGNEYFAIDGAPSLLKNPNFDEEPSSSASAFIGGWYAVTEPDRQWVTVSDGFDGSASKVVRLNTPGAAIRQRIAADNLTGKEVKVRVVARALAEGLETTAGLRMVGNIIGGSVIIDERFGTSFGTTWEEREVSFITPPGLAGQTLQLAFSVSANAPVGSGKLEVASAMMYLPDTDITQVVQARVSDAVAPLEAQLNEFPEKFYSVDGAPPLLANPRFELEPSTSAAGMSGNWYSVVAPDREWVTISDGPDGECNVIRINATSSPFRQIARQWKNAGLVGQEVAIRVTARALAADGETTAGLRLVLDRLGGSVILDHRFSPSFGTDWETRELIYRVPDIGQDDLRFAFSTSPNFPAGSGKLEVASIEVVIPSRDLPTMIQGQIDKSLARGGGSAWRAGTSYSVGDTIVTPMGHTLACAEAHTSRERMTDDLPKWAPVSAPPNEPILAARSRLGHGHAIGIGSRIAVSLRFDDWHLDMRESVIPLLNERGLPSGLASISNLNGQPWISGITEDDIRAWNRTGTEICSHGYDHKDPSPYDLTGKGGLYDQIVNSKKTIESWNIHCRGWMQPGATPLIPDVIPYGTGFTSWQSMEGYAGWLIRNTYPVSLSYVYGAAASQLPRSAMHGGSHTTISDGMAFSAVMGALERALERGRSIAFMIHAGNLGKPGNMSLAEFTQVLDWLVEKRAAGLVEVITPTGMVFADHSNHRDEGIRNGDFARGESEWSNLSSGRAVQSGEGYKGSGFVSISRSSSGLITQSIPQLKSRAWDGHTFMFEGYARAQSATTTARVTIAGGDLSLDKTFVDIGTEWTPVYVPFTIPPGVPDIQVGVGHAAGENIDWDCVSIHPI